MEGYEGVGGWEGAEEGESKERGGMAPLGYLFMTPEFLVTPL